MLQELAKFVSTRTKDLSNERDRKIETNAASYASYDHINQRRTDPAHWYSGRSWQNSRKKMTWEKNGQ